MPRICLICGEEIPVGRPKNAVYCSHRCYEKYRRTKYMQLNPYKGKSTATTGTIAELRVGIDLLVKGYDVFRALSPSCSCDLAVLKDKKLLRIEVRSTHKGKDGKIGMLKDLVKADCYAFVLPNEIIYEPPLE